MMNFGQPPPNPGVPGGALGGAVSINPALSTPQPQGMNPQLLMLLKLLGIGGVSALLQNVMNKGQGSITPPPGPNVAPSASGSIAGALQHPSPPVPRPAFAPPAPPIHPASARHLA